MKKLFALLLIAVMVIAVATSCNDESSTEGTQNDTTVNTEGDTTVNTEGDTTVNTEGDKTANAEGDNAVTTPDSAVTTPDSTVTTPDSTVTTPDKTTTTEEKPKDNKSRSTFTVGGVTFTVAGKFEEVAAKDNVIAISNGSFSISVNYRGETSYETQEEKTKSDASSTQKYYPDSTVEVFENEDTGIFYFTIKGIDHETANCEYVVDGVALGVITTKFTEEALNTISSIEFVK